MGKEGGENPGYRDRKPRKRSFDYGELGKKAQEGGDLAEKGWI